jgi:integrase
MASVFKPTGSDKYLITYRDENGHRRKKWGTHDKAVTQRIANDLENKIALRVEGLVDPRDESYAAHAAAPLSEHLAAWKAALDAKGATRKHAELFSSRAAKVVALVKGAQLADLDPPKNATHADLPRYETTLADRMKSARLPELTADRVQRALATLRNEGRSLATVNHHRAAIKAFSAWCLDRHRTREDELRGVPGYNAKEDPRHERRTESLENVQRLIAAAESGKVVLSVTGPVRALVYRLAIETGLRYSEVGSIRPESFDWKARTVTVEAA